MAARRPLVLVDGVIRELPSNMVLLGGPAVVTDHGGMSGLGDDDHPQYINQARGDGRYAALGHGHDLSALAQGGAGAGQVLQWNGSAWVPATLAAQALSVQRATTTATQASSATALAAITQLSLPMAANSIYRVECFVTFQSAATTTGLNLAIATPAGCRNAVEVVVPITSTAASTQLRTIFPSAAAPWNISAVLGLGVTAASQNHTARISGLLVNGSTAGNCQINFASEVSGSAVTIQTGSELILLKVT